LLDDETGAVEETFELRVWLAGVLDEFGSEQMA
jgi:hypothetical protein